MQVGEAIVLTFVANSFCNFACSYCYLGRLTDKKERSDDAATAFKKIAKRLLEQGVIIKQVILHGAEITAAPIEDVGALLEAINEYKNEHLTEILSFNPGLGIYISVKTNLYNFDKFYSLFEKHGVGVSGSVDLPLRLHEKNRVLKGGTSSLKKVLSNLALLANYPHFHQFSATMSAEYLNAKEFSEDIAKCEALGFDMANNFYIMFAYPSKMARDEVKSATSEAVVKFYRELREIYRGSRYEKAVELIWFKEFLGGYCTASNNCGDKVLVQKNGDCFICHRSQSIENFRQNIFKMPFNDILNAHKNEVCAMENAMKLSDECKACEYFYLCGASCVIERRDTGLGKSYVCELSKEIFRNNPGRFKPDIKASSLKLNDFLRANAMSDESAKMSFLPSLNNEFMDAKNNIARIIKNDKTLMEGFRDDNFFLFYDDKISPLNSDFKPICKVFDFSFCFTKDQQNSNALTQELAQTPWLLIRKELFGVACDEPKFGYLYMDFLGAGVVRYGDEGRDKSPHTGTFCVPYAQLESRAKDLGEYFALDLGRYLELVFGADFGDKAGARINYLFVTTSTFRAYHYAKQAKNAFYHAQSINLPFHRVEFKI